MDPTPPCRSIYPWQGTVEHTKERPFFAKTPVERHDALQEIVRTLPPYELPGIIAVRRDAGMSASLEWVAAETRPTA